jgi:hypothetical protein
MVSMEGSPKLIKFLRVQSFFWLIIGIVTAVFNVTVYGGFIPIYWFLFSFISLIASISHTLLGIRATLEKK